MIIGILDIPIVGYFDIFFQFKDIVIREGYCIKQMQYPVIIIWKFKKKPIFSLMELHTAHRDILDILIFFKTMQCHTRNARYIPSVSLSCKVVCA